MGMGFPWNENCTWISMGIGIGTHRMGVGTVNSYRSQIIPIHLLNYSVPILQMTDWLCLLSCWVLPVILIEFLQRHTVVTSEVLDSNNARKLWLTENTVSGHSIRSDTISCSTLPVFMYDDFRCRLFRKQPWMGIGMAGNGNGGNGNNGNGNEVMS